jgi:RHS repeat-associated protein
VRDLVDNSGANVKHIKYDSFGKVKSQSSSIETRFGYTGKALDEDTGLQNNWHRWYDAAVGRWLSEDPIGFAAGDSNLYRYVGNNATNATDPNGLQTLPSGLEYRTDVKPDNGMPKGVDGITNHLMGVYDDWAEANEPRPEGERAQAMSEAQKIKDLLKKAQDRVKKKGGPITVRFERVGWPKGTLCHETEQETSMAFSQTQRFRFFNYVTQFGTKRTLYTHAWGAIEFVPTGKRVVTVDLWKDFDNPWRPGVNAYGWTHDGDLPPVKPYNGPVMAPSSCGMGHAIEYWCYRNR